MAKQTAERQYEWIVLKWQVLMDNSRTALRMNVSFQSTNAGGRMAGPTREQLKHARLHRTISHDRVVFDIWEWLGVTNTARNAIKTININSTIVGGL